MFHVRCHLVLTPCFDYVSNLFKISRVNFFIAFFGLCLQCFTSPLSFSWPFPLTSLSFSWFSFSRLLASSCNFFFCPWYWARVNGKRHIDAQCAIFANPVSAVLFHSMTVHQDWFTAKSSNSWIPSCTRNKGRKLTCSIGSVGWCRRNSEICE